MERPTLLKDIIGSLSYKLENQKTCEARREFECYGCGELMEKGSEFYFVGKEMFCPDCVAEGLKEAKAWLEELEALPPEDKGGDQGDKAGDGSGGDGEML